MSESIILHIPLSEEYDALFAEAREQTNLRKCHCWFDRSIAIEDIRVEVTDSDIGIRYETKKGTVADRSVYSSISSLTEVRRGIVLRLSHGRMLFLPAGGGRDYMQALMKAIELMEQHIRYRFRESSMVLPGIGIVTRLQFRLRPTRGLYFPRSHMDAWTKWSVAALMCFIIFLSTLFVTEPIRNREITPDQAETVTAVYESAERHRRKGSTRSVTLHFQDHPDLTVEYRPPVAWDALEQVESGAVMELLVHPGDAGVLQLVADGVVLLDFEMTMEVARREAVAFAWFGVFLYFCVGYVVYDVFLKKKGK